MCTYPDCDNPTHAKGLCMGHYQQQRRGADLSPLAKHAGRKKARAKICTAAVTPACDQPVLARGLCPRHYYRDRKGLPMGGAA